MLRGSFFLLLILYIRNSSCIMESIYDTGKEIWKLYSMLDKMSLSDDSNAGEVNVLFSDNNTKNQVDEIFKHFDQMEPYMNPKTVIDSLKLLPSEVILHSSMTALEASVQSIDNSYGNFRQYMNEMKHLSSSTLAESFRNAIQLAEGDIIWLRKLTTEANQFLFSHKNLVNAISDYAVRLSAQLCGDLQVISDVLAQLFKMVIIAEMKVNHMLTVANIDRYSANEGWKLMNSFARDRFEEHFAAYVEVFAHTIDTTSSLYLRACDAADGLWIRNRNFYEFERTFQTTIFRYHWGVCKYGSCNDMLFQTPNRCEAEIYDERSSCSDTQDQCIYLNAIEACVLKRGPYKFQYVKSSELGALGSNFECPKDDGYLIEDGKGWNTVYSACACNCYASHNKISVSIIESRVASNMVFTGLRFMRKNKILSIQPREGILEANGHISQSSQRWIPIPNELHTSLIHSIDRENRVFFLDDLRLPSSYVLTGVKFDKVRRGNLTGFAIQIFGAPFDYKTGIVHCGDTFRVWRSVSTDNTGGRLVFDRVRPINESVPQTPSPVHFRYVLLDQSELSADFGQSTLPFFDVVPVRTNPPSALGGVGIFHKGVAGYAGFISLRVFGIVYKNYFSDFQRQYILHDRVLFNGSNYN